MNKINNYLSLKTLIDNLLKKESHQKLMTLIDKIFIERNKIYPTQEYLSKSIIISLFGIIIYEFDLYHDFEELIQLNNEKKLLNENNKLIIFINIYEKINFFQKILSQIEEQFSIIKQQILLNKDKLKTDLQNQNQSGNNNGINFYKDFNDFISNIIDKINFIIENKKPREYNDKSVNAEINLQKIDNIINFLFFYLAENIGIKLHTEKIVNELNEELIQKEKVLNYLNKLLYISNNTQDIKDLIYTIDRLIKNGSKTLCYLENKIEVLDESLLERYKKQVYIYLLQIINLLKKDDNNNNYDTSYYITLVKALFWNFTQK